MKRILCRVRIEPGCWGTWGCVFCVWFSNEKKKVEGICGRVTADCGDKVSGAGQLKT